MIRALIWLLSLGALAVGVAIAARYNEGYVLMVLPPWRIELSLNLLLLLLVGGFVLLYSAVRTVATVLGLPASVQAFRRRRAQLAAESALQDAIRLLFEGRFATALKRAEVAYEAGHARGLAAVLAMRAAQSMRDARREADWQARARRHDDEIRGARLMVETIMAVEGRDFDRAQGTLEQLVQESGRHVAAQRLALRVQQGLGNWREVLRLTRTLEKHRAMTPLQAAPLRYKAHRESFRQLRDDGDALEKYVRQMPDAERLDPRLAELAARALIEAGNTAEASRLIEEVLDEQWDSGLVAVYSLGEGGDVLGRISHAETWLHAHPRDAKLLLTLGRLCRQQSLWGKAQSYLEASVAIAPSREAHIALAQLLDALDRPAEADRHYRAAAEPFF